VKVYNYFNLRWVDGYSFVSDAPNNINSLVKDVAERAIPSNETPTIQVVFDRKTSMQVALLRATVSNHKTHRNVRFLHAFVVQTDEDLYETADLVSSFLEIYTTNVRASIENLYSQLSMMEKSDQGRQILERYYIRRVTSRTIIPPREMDIQEIYPDEEVSVVGDNIKSAPKAQKTTASYLRDQGVKLLTLRNSLILMLLLVTLTQFLIIVGGILGQEPTLSKLYQGCLAGEVPNGQKIQYIESKDYDVNFFCENKQVRVRIHDAQPAHSVGEFKVELLSNGSANFNWREP
jgi:hypothetical protein